MIAASSCYINHPQPSNLSLLSNTVQSVHILSQAHNLNKSQQIILRHQPTETKATNQHSTMYFVSSSASAAPTPSSSVKYSWGGESENTVTTSKGLSFIEEEEDDMETLKTKIRSLELSQQAQKADLVEKQKRRADHVTKKRAADDHLWAANMIELLEKQQEEIEVMRLIGEFDSLNELKAEHKKTLLRSKLLSRAISLLEWEEVPAPLWWDSEMGVADSVWRDDITTTHADGESDECCSQTLCW
jgi:hypothetical protein